jgi:tetratricopeptide (TPR) repeat protein
MRLLAAILRCWLTSLGAAEDRVVSAAETAYAQGDYATAVEQWTEEARIEGVTAGRLAALGNAEWRLGRKGRAMVCWERALLLDPRDPVALAGIRHALNAGGTERPALTWSSSTTPRASRRPASPRSGASCTRPLGPTIRGTPRSSFSLPYW